MAGFGPGGHRQDIDTQAIAAAASAAEKNV